MAEATITETFNAPIEKVYETILKYEDYADFIPGTEETKVLETSEEGARVEYAINVVKKFRYVLKMTHERPNTIKWQLDSGDLFKVNSGHWKLKDIGDGKTAAEYHLELGFKMLVPKMILKKLIDTNLPATIAAFRERSES